MIKVTQIVSTVIILSALVSCSHIKKNNVLGEWKAIDSNLAIVFEREGMASVTIPDKSGEICDVKDLYWELSKGKIIAKEYIGGELEEVWINHIFKITTKDGVARLSGNIYKGILVKNKK
ncbi:MAG: hypothetical protein QM484_06305 [Woeseiaceae bacterium]